MPLDVARNRLNRENDDMKTKYKNDWFRKRIAHEREKRDECDELLKYHNKKWLNKKLELYAECESDGGHDYQDLPRNGMNSPSFSTGEWPKACSKCHKCK